MSKFHVRRVGPGDGPGLHHIYRAAISEPHGADLVDDSDHSASPQYWDTKASDFASSRYGFVAETTSAGLVGLIALTPPTPARDMVSSIEFLWVAPHERGLQPRVSDALIRKSLDTAAELDAVSVVLPVAKHNIRAQAVYARNGFVVAESVGQWRFMERPTPGPHHIGTVRRTPTSFSSHSDRPV